MIWATSIKYKNKSDAIFMFHQRNVIEFARKWMEENVKEITIDDCYHLHTHDRYLIEYEDKKGSDSFQIESTLLIVSKEEMLDLISCMKPYKKGE